MPICFHAGSAPSVMFEISPSYDAVGAPAFDNVRQSAGSAALSTAWRFQAFCIGFPNFRWCFRQRDRLRAVRSRSAGPPMGAATPGQKRRPEGTAVRDLPSPMLRNYLEGKGRVAQSPVRRAQPDPVGVRVSACDFDLSQSARLIANNLPRFLERSANKSSGATPPGSTNLRSELCDRRPPCLPLRSPWLTEWLEILN